MDLTFKRKEIISFLFMDISLNPCFSGLNFQTLLKSIYHWRRNKVLILVLVDLTFKQLSWVENIDEVYPKVLILVLVDLTFKLISAHGLVI